MDIKHVSGESGGLGGPPWARDPNRRFAPKGRQIRRFARRLLPSDCDRNFRCRRRGLASWIWRRQARALWFSQGSATTRPKRATARRLLASRRRANDALWQARCPIVTSPSGASHQRFRNAPRRWTCAGHSRYDRLRTRSPQSAIGAAPRSMSRVGRPSPHCRGEPS